MGSRGLREFVNLKYWIHTGGHWVGSRQACTAACVRADGSREWTRENIVPYKPRVLSTEFQVQCVLGSPPDSENSTGLCRYG
jgi:hypothetical protein